jgi:hypothetical protein
MPEPNEVEIVDTRDDGEIANYVVCAPVRPGDDHATLVPGSKQENCCRCGRLVWTSPTAPVTPQRVCLYCALPDINAGGVKLVVSKETIVEVQTALKTKQ